MVYFAGILALSGNRHNPVDALAEPDGILSILIEQGRNLSAHGDVAHLADDDGMRAVARDRVRGAKDVGLRGQKIRQAFVIARPFAAQEPVFREDRAAEGVATSI